MNSAVGGGEVSGNGEACQAFGDFLMGMTVAIVATGADECQGGCLCAIKGVIPTVFAPVVRNNNDAVWLLPRQGVENVRIAIAGKEIGGGGILQIGNDLIGIFTILISIAENAIECKVFAGEDMALRRAIPQWFVRREKR